MDWFHGTDQQFRESKSFLEHKVLTCFKPIKTIYPDLDNELDNNNDYKNK